MPDDPIPEGLIPEEMGFAEFAARLIEETFAAIVTSGLDQQRALDALAATAALSAEAYAAREITAEEITAELSQLFPPLGGRPYVLAAGAPYTPAADNTVEAPAFAQLLGVTLDRTDYTVGRTATTLRPSAIEKLRGAAGLRLATLRLATLRGLLRLGAPRIVVDAGLIKARLVFRVVRLADAEKPAVKSRLASPLRPLRALAAGAPAELNALRFTVRQASDRAPQTSQLSADVFGEVELRFKTIT
jgi:hypothetical protein